MEQNCFDLICRSMPLLTKGAWMTLQIFLMAGCLSISLGTLFGILTCNRLRLKVIAPAIECLTFLLRAIPFYVQLLIFYFVIPEILQINVDAYNVSVLALGICSTGYMTQIIRCGINSIATDQWEAAATLGYSTSACVRYVIFPQMIRNILPALTNEIDALLKSTSILASIGLLELTRMGMNIVSQELEPLTIYLTIAAFYVVISGGVNIISKCIEKRLRYVNG